MEINTFIQQECIKWQETFFFKTTTTTNKKDN